MELEEPQYLEMSDPGARLELSGADSQAGPDDETRDEPSMSGSKEENPSRTEGSSLADTESQDGNDRSNDQAAELASRRAFMSSIGKTLGFNPESHEAQEAMLYQA